jgi:hypothetical protein
MSLSSDDESIDTIIDTYSESNINLFLQADNKTETQKFTIYYFKKGKEFLQKIQPWTYNNPLDPDHIQSIKKEILTNQELTGIFTVIQLENQDLVLIDGHHRLGAMLDIYEEHPDLDLDLEIVVHNYVTDDIESQKTKKLFQKINNTKPFRCEFPIIALVIELIERVSSHYPGLIKNGRTRSNFPFVNKRLLNEALQTRLLQLDNICVENLFCQIRLLNNYYREKSYEEYQKTKRKNWSRDSEKLVEIGCYLGLVKLETWVNRLR